MKLEGEKWRVTGGPVPHAQIIGVPDTQFTHPKFFLIVKKIFQKNIPKSHFWGGRGKQKASIVFMCLRLLKSTFYLVKNVMEDLLTQAKFAAADIAAK